ncbi:hypothetical protein PR048_014395 [Dryococelus australis]|uniref:Uncharacterized protein n=1 Tax=Dryococelus australis TaxID=614101 RepID=A0ABQ9HE58_9NEOP|nr:hypothetical protein PR048_014395 [Dryococelus australis]
MGVRPESLKRELSFAMHIQCGHIDGYVSYRIKCYYNLSIIAQTKVMNQKCQGATGHMLVTEPLQIVCVDIFEPLHTGKDNEPQYKSNKWKTSTTVLGIELGYTAVYHPSANPAERVMKELDRMFRLNCHKKKQHVDNSGNSGATPVEIMDKGTLKTVLQRYIVYHDNQCQLGNPKDKKVMWARVPHLERQFSRPCMKSTSVACVMRLHASVTMQCLECMDTRVLPVQGSAYQSE